MNDVVAPLLMRVLQVLFELLVPVSLDLAVRELLIAFLVAGALWLFEGLRSRLRPIPVPVRA